MKVHKSMAVLLALVLTYPVVNSYRYWEKYDGVVTAYTAQNMDDLQLVLGSGYRLVVAAYWRYFLSTCDVIREKLQTETTSGRMNYFCPYVTKCPVISNYQSCMVRDVSYHIQKACCTISNKDMDDHHYVTQDPYTPDATPTANPIQTDVLLDGQRTCNTASVRPSRRIIGGTAAKPGEFPWVAMLLLNGDFKCACTILDRRHVLTAAHCFEPWQLSNRLEVLAGKYYSNISRTEPGQQRVYVSAYRSHQEYESLTAVNDIAVLHLESPLTWSQYVLPGCLPQADDVLSESCTVVGWGDIDYRSVVTTYPDVQQKVTLNTYTKDECLQTFQDRASDDLRNFVQDGNICAANGLVGGKDACQADSGGPLLCIKGTKTSLAYFQFGIVSSGSHCATPNDPGIYTNVVHYLDWIQRTVKELS